MGVIITKENFDVFGMSCAACAANVEKAVKKVDGVLSVNVNLLRNSMQVEIADNNFDKEGILRAVEKAGYKAQSTSNRQSVKKEEEIKDDSLKKLFWSIGFLLVLMYVSMGHMIGLRLPPLLENEPFAYALTQLLLTLPVVYMYRDYYINGFGMLIRRKPNMDSLVAMGSAAGLIYGIFTMYMISYGYYTKNYDEVHHYAHQLYFESSAMILTLISVGKYLEKRSKKKTTQAVEKLIKLAPDTARVIKDSKEVIIKVTELRINDEIIIKSGETIPCDGIITYGNCTIDESAITGESMPVEKKTGERVTTGPICKSGYITFVADRVGKDTTLSKIIALVEEAASGKAPISRLADRISGVFVPIVISIAAITTIAWLIAGFNFEFALSCGISVLVISCPCALGLATPTAVMAGTGRGANFGILIKSAEALEELSYADTVIMDKTGTITNGEPKITDKIFCNGVSSHDALKYFASCEKLSSHPLAEAICEEYTGDLFEVSDYKELEGMGIVSKINEKEVLAGNIRLMEKYGVDVSEYTKNTDVFYSQGKTVLYLAFSTKIIAIVALADTLKENSKSAVGMFKKMKLKTVLLTGDNKNAAEFIKNEAGIDEVISEVLPHEKEEFVRKMQDSGRKVIMIGDGINDAPALMRANIGMAIGAGTEIAIDSADVVLMKSDPYDAVNAVGLSRATVKNIKENLFWAFIYNIIGIPLAAGIFYIPFGIKLNPMFGAAAMSLSSLFVVCNALRLTYFKPQKYIGTKEEKKEKSVMKKTMKIEGMMCTHCSGRVESVLNEIDGVLAVVNLEKKEATVTLDKEISDDVLVSAVTNAGYKVTSIE